jgi:transposase-like protein
VIVLAVGWYLRFGLSYRDVEELFSTERGVQVDHVTIYRWCCGHAVAGRGCPTVPACCD